MIEDSRSRCVTGRDRSFYSALSPFVRHCSMMSRVYAWERGGRKGWRGLVARGSSWFGEIVLENWREIGLFKFLSVILFYLRIR